MSRIGNAPITIPEGVTVKVTKGGDFYHQLVTVTGPKGSLNESIRYGVTVSVEDGIVTLKREDDKKQNRAYHGLYRSLINNMIIGVSEGYKKELELVGIGYRAEMQGEKLNLSLGFSHKIDFVPPAGIEILVEDQTKLTVSGIDKQAVGETAAKIRGFRPPEPYKGKGVRYSGEVVRRKSVKQGV